MNRHCRIGKITWKTIMRPFAWAPPKIKATAKKARKALKRIVAATAEIRDIAAWDDRAHLKRGFHSRAWDRKPRQKWADWVRTWNPMSDCGKAAKAYSYGAITWGWTASMTWRKNAVRDLLAVETYPAATI